MVKPFTPQLKFTDVAADTSLDPGKPGQFFITKGSICTITLAAPASANDGGKFSFTSTTAFAHVITFTGAKLQNGVTANRTTATLAAVAGASIEVVARSGNWYVLDQSAAVTYA